MFKEMIHLFQYTFMQHAWLACFTLSLSAVPLGTFLMLRRLSLVGDSLSHGILPGIAIGAIFFSMAPLPVFLGGVAVGLCVALFSHILSKNQIIPEDASFTVIYTFSLAIGIVMLFLYAPNTNIIGLLFGNLLAIDKESLYLILSVGLATMIFLFFYRKSLLLYCFDPTFFRAAHKNKFWLMVVFILLVVANLVISYQAIGTLLALGLMMLPTIAARLLSNHYRVMFFLSSLIGVIGSTLGIIISFYTDSPSGPMIIITLSCITLCCYIYNFTKHFHFL